MIVLLGAAIVACLTGIVLGAVFVGAGIMMWWPSAFIPLLLGYYIFRPVKHPQPAPVPFVPYAVQPHHAQPPSPNSMDNPWWL